MSDDEGTWTSEAELPDGITPLLHDGRAVPGAGAPSRPAPDLDAFVALAGHGAPAR